MQQKLLHRKFDYVRDIDETEYNQIVYERKEKLLLYDQLTSEGCSQETSLVAIGASRATYHRWKKNYKEFGLVGLENESTRPNKVRKSQWSKQTEQQIYHLRIKYPIWGKEKIAVMMQRIHNQKVSISSVGRILKKLLHEDKIQPVRFHLYNKKDTKRRKFDGHSQRWQAHMKARTPGELIQIDHMSVYLPGYGYIKHFTAVCPITKIAAHRAYDEATSKNAADFLCWAQKEFPFPIVSIQVDGGAEFRDEFERKCQANNIDLFVLPPRSPECNGNVERNNGTVKYEFYGRYDGPANHHTIQKNLQKFVQFHNKVRPHRGIGLLTPCQFFELMEKRP